MSHAMYARTTSEPESYLAKFNNHSAIANDIYNALDAQQFNNSCSGSGASKVYTCNQLREAIKKTNFQEAADFIGTALNSANNENVRIIFA